MELFQHARRQQIQQESPLANRMRPRTLDEFAGQDHIIGPGRLLRRAIEADQLSSLIFYGPPGTGKTTLAMVIANTTRSHFVTMNAVMSGVKELREVVADATERQTLYGTRTTLFVDEVHRWNKAQQDALLPYVEKGIVILIGATTANPYFEVNKALVSRSRIFQLKPLMEADLHQILRQTLADKERGYGDLQVEIEPDAADHLVHVANGDARSLLNALELAVETTTPGEDGLIRVNLDVAEESIQRRAVLYDKDGDAHYDHISAFIKSLRGSDPDAALYWAARMIYAGEDPGFIFRRMGIFAGEDIGLADPQAALVVDSCWSLFERIGLPEGQFPLAQAVLYLATAPKSNTTLSFFDALKAVEDEREEDVPNHLKDANRDAKGFGHGVGYKYPHAYQDHWVAQQYLPAELQGRVFYQPGELGYEGGLAVDVLRRREEQLAAWQEQEPAPAEILTMSPESRGREAWLARTLSSSGRALGSVRDRVFDLAGVQRHHLVLDLRADSGLFLWEAVRRAPEGGVWGLVAPANLDGLAAQGRRLAEVERPHLITSLDELADEALLFDRLLAYNPLPRLEARQVQLAAWIPRLREDGLAIIAQPIPSLGQRIYALIDWSGHEPLQATVEAVEEGLWTAADQPLTGWTAEDLRRAAEAAGWKATLETAAVDEERRLSGAQIKRWFDEGNPYADALAAAGLDPKQLQALETLYRRQLENRTLPWRTGIAYMTLSRGKPARKKRKSG